MIAQTVKKLTEIQLTDLEEFLGSRDNTNELIQAVKDFTKPVGTMYRGIRYPKKDLNIGQPYTHGYALSSWSKSEEIATKFACNDYLPEGVVEEAYEEKYGEYKTYLEMGDEMFAELEEAFTHILLIDEEGAGFCVNENLPNHDFVHEEEVIVYDGEWVFESFEEAVFINGLTYYQVKVKRKVA